MLIIIIITHFYYIYYIDRSLAGGDRSLVTNYRPVNLTSVVCKQMEHVIASYLRQVLYKMTGYTRVNMVSGRHIRAKVKYPMYAKTLRPLWITETGLRLL